MKNLCLILLFFLMQTVSGQNQATTTLYLIRHAEKADFSGNPELSDAGMKRAKSWAAYFEKTPIDLFYTTMYKRTQQTCSAIAATKQKDIIFYKPEAMDLKKIIAENPGKTLLIVGHSNTIPNYINKLLGTAKYADIPEPEFGNLYRITVTGEEIWDELIHL
ncbi:SixA phosphatase family protein [Flavobacterium lindanitolerans]|uniref:Broad specificity phosphatase PhoE n=1 Tax=Flavobacterium lindanitolerans TaxID=428988 RepID=A0A497UPI6_9FLAO|nr:phosphoglycerate mutase family protein [Flavobacterium lindanitolerans]PKW20996.1 broad specificity phosphatase PhoE [Flavobacterium lindanitolerans]RLJ30365.1 broad specificity phosphatase PhoE [Flavobacterium lindanitolerans]